MSGCSNTFRDRSEQINLVTNKNNEYFSSSTCLRGLWSQISHYQLRAGQYFYTMGSELMHKDVCPVVILGCILPTGHRQMIALKFGN